MATLNKQKLIIALQSKVTLLNRRVMEQSEARQFAGIYELDAKIAAYQEIQKAVINGNFDK
ncbi:MAG: hypothetical protein K0U78_15300 [Actinomycetia bacterium]|nr:hypothetical protein [Actinomycetes bacterium]